MKRRTLLLATSALLVSIPALAQDNPSEPAVEQSPSTEGADAAEIIVTGVSRATNRLDTSISVSALTAESVIDAAPRGASEIYRRIPGIRSESSAGGGNSNIGVRGLPIFTGGAQFVSQQEDGLPVLLFGDHNFAPADGFIKIDSTLARVEAVRGGTASTLTTNGNGAIINLISKTGKQEGGNIIALKGLDYKDTRIDAEYGGPITESLYFHIGGHYQSGGDYRNLGYNGVEGGKVRASLTKEFDRGFVRVFAQFIDKKDATYMPQATRITEVPGSVALFAAGAPNYGRELGRLTNNLPGLEAHTQSIHSPQLFNFPTIDPAGNLRSTDLKKGFNTKATSIGGEFEFEVTDGLTISDKIRYNKFTGDFVAPFTHQVSNADTLLATTFGGAAATFFNGPNAGQPVTSASLTQLTGNNLITEIAFFDTEFNDMGNFANDLRATQSFDVGGGTIDINAGYFKMVQQFGQTWHWGRALVSTENNASIINVAGVTENGVYTYNGAFGACCNIVWDLEANVDAAYGGITAALGRFNIDASLRHEWMNYSGTARFNSPRNVDVNRNGVIGPAEIGVPITNATPAIANDGLDGTSYSVGFNFRATDDLALFARYSKGITWNFDRQFGAFDGASGRITNPGLLKDGSEQIEAGVKWRETGPAIPGSLSVYLTLFEGRANLSNASVTQPGTVVAANFRSRGAELELSYQNGGFNLFGNATYTDAKTIEDLVNPARVGLKPRRQADFIYNVGASYTFAERFTFGASVNGTTDSYVDFENRFIQPGFATVGAFANVGILDNLTLSVNANNLFNTVGFTEGDESRLFDTDSNGAYDTSIGRSIAGRTISASLKLDF